MSFETLSKYAAIAAGLFYVWLYLEEEEHLRWLSEQSKISEEYYETNSK